MYLQNQLKQCVKGSYIIKYWSTVDGMCCFIYYHLDVNKGCRGKICIHNFQPLKLIKQDFSIFFVATSRWHVWHILQRVLLILSELNQKDQIIWLAVSSIKLFLKTVDLEKNLSDIKNKGWQQSIDWHLNSYGPMLMMLFIWKSFTNLINLLT